MIRSQLRYSTVASAFVCLIVMILLFALPAMGQWISQIKDNAGVVYTMRPYLQFGTNCVVADDPTNYETDINCPGAGCTAAYSTFSGDSTNASVSDCTNEIKFAGGEGIDTSCADGTPDTCTIAFDSVDVTQPVITWGNNSQAGITWAWDLFGATEDPFLRFFDGVIQSGVDILLEEDETLIFEGATDDGFETTLNVVDPTVDRAINLPNEDGTICTTGSVCSGYESDTHASSHDGTGVSVSGELISTASTEAGFLATGQLTCGAGDAGKITAGFQQDSGPAADDPLQYCRPQTAGGSLLTYAPWGNVDGEAISVALGGIDDLTDIDASLKTGDGSFIPTAETATPNTCVRYNSTSAMVPSSVDCGDCLNCSHGNLINLDADDHSKYLYLEGRATGQTVSGGTSDGETLTIQASQSSMPRTGRIELDQINVFNSTFNYPSAGVVGIRHNPVVNTINSSNPIVQAMDIQPAYTYTVDQSHGFAIKAGMTFRPKWITGSNLGASDDDGQDNVNVYGIWLKPEIDPTGDGVGAGRTVTQNVALYWQPNTQGSAGTVTTVEGARFQPSIAAGTTVTNMRALRIIPPTSGGTLTNWEGLLIADTSLPGTLNAAIRQQGVNGHNRFQGDTMVGQDATPSATLHVSEANIGSKVQTLESQAAGSPEPAEHVYQGRVSATSGSSFTLFDLSTTNNRAYLVEARCVGHCTSGASCPNGQSDASAVWVMMRTFRRTTSLAQVGSLTNVHSQRDTSMPTCSLATFGNSIRTSCNGAAGATIIWHATIRVYEVGT